jgi:uronate dehydrogenase
VERLLITGAAGGVGTLLRQEIRGLAAKTRLLDLRQPDAVDNEEVMLGDVADLAIARRAIAGCDACVHLAAISVEAPFDQILRANIQGTWALFEAARLEGCERIVFATTNHVTGFYPVTQRIGPSDPVRPDTYYGVSKVFGEGLGRLYHDKFGLRVACIRIGTAIPRPVDERHLSTWLSPGDLGRLVTACLTSPDLGFAIVYGASANRRGWWDLEPGRKLGYEPQDDAEIYANDVEPMAPYRFQGSDDNTAPGSTP